MVANFKGVVEQVPRRWTLPSVMKMTDDESVVMDGGWLMMDHWWMTHDGWWTADDGSSIMSPIIIHHQSSTIRHQSAFHHPSSAIHHPSSLIDDSDGISHSGEPLTPTMYILYKYRHIILSRYAGASDASGACLVLQVRTGGTRWLIYVTVLSDNSDETITTEPIWIIPWPPQMLKTKH